MLTFRTRGRAIHTHARIVRFVVGLALGPLRRPEGWCVATMYPMCGRMARPVRWRAGAAARTLFNSVVSRRVCVSNMTTDISLSMKKVYE